MHGNINIGILGCTVHRQMANSGAFEAPAPIKTNIETNVSLLNLHFTKSGPLKMSQDFSSQVFFSIWQFTWWQVFKTFLTSLNPCSGRLWWLNLALHGLSPVRRWNRFSFDGELFASGLMWQKTSVMTSKDRYLCQEHRRIYIYMYYVYTFDSPWMTNGNEMWRS